jgi:hypothetical protein
MVTGSHGGGRAVLSSSVTLAVLDCRVANPSGGTASVRARQVRRTGHAHCGEPVMCANGTKIRGALLVLSVVTALLSASIGETTPEVNAVDRDHRSEPLLEAVPSR